ncbi:MSHA biogenesis protein MshF [Vibrio sinensis]|uniref:MSHA biogenesis protein MshF n=1 Tax=Vibrio sinensis TaxID=2302434 RepID=A0A3A6QQD8_9VIBR|nr:MSHA biogenesis protein MshF [Vibrio sinensis]RJX70682.1 MSHA biogenesis protein MshF [Vibrio sinensis]
MTAYIRRLRVAVWFLVVMVLVLSCLLVAKGIEKDANQTALLLASNSIVERANYYKQQWLLHNNPDELKLQGNRVKYSKNGWVVPNLSGDQVDCQRWFTILYPQQHVYGDLPSRIVDNSYGSTFKCEYLFSPNMHLTIGLKDKKFEVGVGFTSG